MTSFKKQLKNSVLTGATLAAMAFVPLAAQAQTTDTDDVIIVTTERREQSLQDVAATVQAFSGADLQRLGVNSNFDNLQYVVPGLQIARQEGKLEVFLRGIGSTDSDFSSDPSVATHYNGVYLARPRGIGPLFFDSERVEVNKGPQGTLRGRNATGGTINIISNKPEFDEFYGYVQGGIGNFDSREFEGVVNLPITDTFATRLSVWTKKQDGLYTNEFLQDDEANFLTPSSSDDLAVRLSALWEPNDQFSANFIYTYSDVNSSGDPGTFSGRSLAAGYDIEDLDDPWNQYFRTEGDFDQEVQTFIANANYDFGNGIGVEYLGSYNSLDAYNKNASREWQLGMVFPGSETQAAVIASGVNPQRNLQVNDTFQQGEVSDALVQEIRFYSTDSETLNWTAGAFYFKEEYSFISWDVNNGFCGNSDFFGRDAPLGPQTISCWQDGLGGENRGNDSEIESIAVYADATYSVSDRLRLKAGIRWTDEEKTQNDGNVGQYRYTFNADFLESEFGVNEPSDIILGGTGFRLTGAGDRELPASVVRDPGTGEGVLGSGNDIFLGGIESFGLGDNLNLIFDQCLDTGQCEITVARSQFDDPTTEDVIELTATNKVSDNYVDWRVGFEFDAAPDNLVYGTVSTGTRSGGINRPLVLSDGRQLDQIWEPETLTVYELGSKNRFDVNGMPVILNGAMFYYDYKDKVYQNLVDVPNPQPGNPDATTQQVFTNNASDANIFGVEVEGNVQLPAGFDVNATVLYLDSEIENSGIVDPRTNANNVVDIDGNELQNVSDWNINLRVSQTIPVEWQSVSSLDWTVNLAYRSEYFLTPFNNKGYELDGDGNTVEIPLADMPAPNTNGILNVPPAGTPGGLFFSDVVPASTIVNAVAGVNFGEDDQFRFDVYAENLFEEAISTKGFVNASVNIRYLNSPRIFGARLRAKF